MTQLRLKAEVRDTHLLREHSFFRRGGGKAGGIPMSMNVKISSSPPFIFFVKNVTLPQEAVKSK